MPATSEQCRQYRQRLKERAYLQVGGLFPCCAKCGDDERLQMAHTKPTGLNGHGRGLSRRYLDVLKNIDSYRLLCRGCHKDFDSQTIPF